MKSRTDILTVKPLIILLLVAIPAALTPFSPLTDTVTHAQTESSTTPDASSEKAALIALYNATNGASWTQSNNWLSEQPVATWYGVITGQSGHVTELRLSNTGLSGPIPDLSPLTNLTTLDLSHNQLRGPVPDLSALTSLTSLNLSSNQLRGPVPNLNTLTSLTSLNLSSNQLSGPSQSEHTHEPDEPEPR